MSGSVMPAKLVLEVSNRGAGIQSSETAWIPACAGMTGVGE